MARDVKALGALHPRAKSDINIETEGEADDQIGPLLYVHFLFLLVNAEFAVDGVHLPAVYINQDDKEYRGSLLSDPHTEWNPAEAESVELFHEKNAENTGDEEPDD